MPYFNAKSVPWETKSGEMTRLVHMIKVEYNYAILAEEGINWRQAGDAITSCIGVYGPHCIPVHHNTVIFCRIVIHHLYVSSTSSFPS